MRFVRVSVGATRVMFWGLRVHSNTLFSYHIKSLSFQITLFGNAYIIIVTKSGVEDMLLYLIEKQGFTVDQDSIDILLEEASVNTLLFLLTKGNCLFSFHLLFSFYGKSALCDTLSFPRIPFYGKT